MTAKMKAKRKRAREAFAALFPRGDARVTCGPASRERHVSKARFRELAMGSTAEALERLQD